MKNKEWVSRFLAATKGSPLQTNIDLGSIQDNGSLVLDQFPVPIPPEGYLVAEWDLDVPDTSRLVQLATPVAEDATDTASTTYSELTRIDFHVEEQQGLIADVRPRFMAGDRVLTLWLSNEPIILCKVVSGEDA